MITWRNYHVFLCVFFTLGSGVIYFQYREDTAPYWASIWLVIGLGNAWAVTKEQKKVNKAKHAKSTKS